jgi:hypothetical protein
MTQPSPIHVTSMLPTSQSIFLTSGTCYTGLDANATLFLFPYPLLASGYHWKLAIYDAAPNILYLLDPYGKHVGDGDDYLFAEVLRQELQGCYPAVLHAPIEYEVHNICKQHPSDARNCGVYVLVYAYYYLKFGRFPCGNELKRQDVQAWRIFFTDWVMPQQLDDAEDTAVLVVGSSV